MIEFQRPDVALVDIGLPASLNGYDVATEESSANANCPRRLSDRDHRLQPTFRSGAMAISSGFPIPMWQNRSISDQLRQLLAAICETRREAEAKTDFGNSRVARLTGGRFGLLRSPVNRAF